MKYFLLFLTIFTALPFQLQAAQDEPLGRIQIVGKAKWLYSYQRRDNDVKSIKNASLESGKAVESLETTNIEVDISGKIGNKISFLFEFISPEDLKDGSDPNEIGPIGVRQAYAVISDVIPMTSIKAGSFNLPVSIYQPRPTNQYDLISLPLINTTAFIENPIPDRQIGTVYNPVGMGWKVTGLNLVIRPYDKMEFDFAYFKRTGQDPENDDEDIEKSTMVKLTFYPTKNSMLSGGIITEGWNETGLYHQEATMTVVSGYYDNGKIETNFDWMQSTVEDYMLDDEMDLQDIESAGYQVTLGYYLTDKIEALCRYEWIDPNTADDNDFYSATMSDNDQRTWLTLGLNYSPNHNSEVALNYIFKTEQGDQIRKRDGEIPFEETTPDKFVMIDPKYQSIQNDLLLLQFQIWQ